MSETIGLTEDQLTELHNWMAQKALKHALSMEVPCLHLDNILTSSVAVHEALSNYSKATDIRFHGELVEEILHAEAVEEEKVSSSRWWSSGQAEDEDMASAEIFFGGQLRQRIRNSSPSIPALAEFVLQRLRDGRHPTGSTVSASFAHLMVDESQFSDTNVIVGCGAAGTEVLKNWMTEISIVAVKELQQQLQRIPPEIETQARVRHPNVLPLLCCFQELRRYDHMVPKMARNPGTSVHPVLSTRKVLGLAMELMFCDLDKLISLRKDRITGNQNRSGTTGAILARSPFPFHVAVDIMLQIAKGMEYLHRHHIMHRDLKPANILITPDSVIPPTVDDDDDRRLSVRDKVADFSVSKSGFSTNISSMSHSANVGTGIWRAPEVMQEDENKDTTKYNAKADVYSFAMVCYHILTGKVPFEFDDDRPSALRRKIRTQQLRPEFHIDQMNNCPSMSCPMAIDDMVRCCWHPDTSARPKFIHIANFLRYMKICAVQMMGAVDDHTERLQKLLGMPLFSIFFDSKQIPMKLWEMRVESTRILVELEMRLARDASGENVSNATTTSTVPDISSSGQEIKETTAAGADVTNRNGWTDSNGWGGASGFIARYD